MSLVGMTIAAERNESSAEGSATERVPAKRWARLARPALGLALPVGLALAWEIAVRLGLSSDRLVPPPSVIFNQFVELARAGELQRHVVATLLRVAAGFGLGMMVGTLFGA